MPLSPLSVSLPAAPLISSSPPRPLAVIGIVMSGETANSSLPVEPMKVIRVRPAPQS